MRGAIGNPRPLLSATTASNGGVHRLSTGETVLLPDRDEFYAAFTERNRGLIDAEEQAALRQATIMVFGCGALGGAAIESLVRAGAEGFVIVDREIYDLTDANREYVRIQDLGRRKVDVLVERTADVNPFARMQTFADSIDGDRLADLVGGVDIVIDASDRDDEPSVYREFEVHRAARGAGKPVIAGFDVAGTQWAAVYDYRDGSRRLLDGRVTERDFPGLEPFEFLARMIEEIKIPIEMVPEVERQLRGQALFLPHLGYTAQLFGALATRIVFDLLMRRPVKSNVVVDIPNLVRPRREQLKLAGRRLAMLHVVNGRLRALRRAGRLGMFSPLDDAAFAGMRDIMEERAWDEGSVIFYQGEPGDAFYVVAEGRVQIEREEDDGVGEPRVIATLGPGEFFGEQALLSDEPRNATVVAATHCRLLSLSREAFETYLHESAAAAARVREIAEARASNPDTAG